MRSLFSYYSYKLPVYLSYMLQQVEYDPNKFIEWILRFPNVSTVTKRKSLVWTEKVKALVSISVFMQALYILVFVFCFFMTQSILFLPFILLTPFALIVSLYFIVFLAWHIVEKPKRIYEISQAEKVFAEHKGIKIAISGSYGKTTMKEMLYTVLSPDKKVAKTPGNKNVSISHARWSKNLTGKEEILLIEYGESQPGDIINFATNTHPDIGIITGLAPNHLDKYKTVNSVANDLLSLGNYVEKSNLFINGDDHGLVAKSESKAVIYSKSGILDWKISDIKTSINGVSFKMKKSNTVLNINSALLGAHQVGPLAFVAQLAHDKFGLTKTQVENNIRQIKPYEHRMKPRNLNGAWIIDDTYNGSLEGLRAGLTLLKDLNANRKIFVTPGLVDQGEKTEEVHIEIGKLIALSKPDKVVLFKNSVAAIISKSAVDNNYQGEIDIVDEPLSFYTNLMHHIASGDIVLMQNDWTDNYS